MTDWDLRVKRCVFYEELVFLHFSSIFEGNRNFVRNILILVDVYFTIPRNYGKMMLNKFLYFYTRQTMIIKLSITRAIYKRV
jgi:hypothetical protein